MPVPVPGALLRRRAASMLALLGIPLLAAGVYFSIGSPDLPDAPLARDLRLLVRERLKSGDSDAQVREFLVARYGEFALLGPRISPRTIVFWAAPGFVLVMGLIGIALWMRRRATGNPVPLSPEEKQRLSKLTDK